MCKYSLGLKTFYWVKKREDFVHSVLAGGGGGSQDAAAMVTTSDLPLLWSTQDTWREPSLEHTHTLFENL